MYFKVHNFKIYNMNKNTFHLLFLPQEILIGINIINAQTVFNDDKIHNVYGFELGFLFFKFSYMRIGSKVS